MRYNKSIKAFQPATADGSLDFLYECLGLSNSGDTQHDSHRDGGVLFVSIDFENPTGLLEDTPNVASQVGIAMLDTRDLIPSSSSEGIISTYNFLLGPPRYYSSAKTKFLFGETQWIKQREIAPKLESLVLRSRSIVLVGHDIANELRVLRHLDFDLKTAVIGILDTLLIAPPSPSFNTQVRSRCCTTASPMPCSQSSLCWE
ncbi:hypothetical protein DL769_005826 [Monosporascus sp. CRB-8-3]|nr:hypothetical protein DL769_005826 [Monosporascus sp. CRB-8-3]